MSEPGAQSAPSGSPSPVPVVVGRRYGTRAEFARPEHLAAYAQAVGDQNPRYAVGPAQVAPPLYAVKPLFAVVQALLHDPDAHYDLPRLVHGEQDMEFVRPIRPWDIVAPRATILAVEEKRSGVLVRGTQILRVEGEVAVRVTASYFIRAAVGGAEARSKDAAPTREVAPPTRPAPLFVVQRAVDAQMTARYAMASDDHNPLHLDDDAARAAGLPGRILHGLATMALTQGAVIDEVCGGDPTRLLRLSARFVRPVYPGDTLTITAWSDEVRLNLEVANQAGVPVMTGAATTR